MSRDRDHAVFRSRPSEPGRRGPTAWPSEDQAEALDRVGPRCSTRLAAPRALRASRGQPLDRSSGCPRSRPGARSRLRAPPSPPRQARMDHAGRGTRVSSSNFGVAAVRFATTRMRAGELIPHGSWHRRSGVASAQSRGLPMGRITDADGPPSGHDQGDWWRTLGRPKGGRSR